MNQQTKIKVPEIEPLESECCQAPPVDDVCMDKWGRCSKCHEPAFFGAQDEEVGL